MMQKKSFKPGKSRKLIFAAPLHRRQKLVSAHLSKELRMDLKRRSLELRKGDEVKVMRGKFSGAQGKVTKVDLKKTKVFVENIKRKKVSGEEVSVPLHPSNLMIVKAELSDKKRQEIIERSLKK